MAGAQQVIEGRAKGRIGEIAQGHGGVARIDLPGKVIESQRQRNTTLGPAQILHQLGFACELPVGAAPAVAGSRHGVRQDVRAGPR